MRTYARVVAVKRVIEQLKVQSKLRITWVDEQTDYGSMVRF
jgi:hypothetical protein